MTRAAPDNERFLSRWSRLKRAQAADAEAAGVAKTDSAETDPAKTDAAKTDAGTANAAPPGTRPLAAPPAMAATASSASHATTATVGAASPVLPAIESLTMDSDYGQFFQPKVPEALKRAAVKKLFTDPHFNIMDGLDTYIDDYSRPDPIPPDMLARLLQARDIVDHPTDRKPEAAAQAPVVAVPAGAEGVEQAEAIAAEQVETRVRPQVELADESGDAADSYPAAGPTTTA